VMDEQLNLRALSTSQEKLVQALHRELLQAWDIYAAGGVTPCVDGARCARAPRRCVRITARYG